MTDDLVSFNMLVVSDASAERELLRRAALAASFHIEVSEIEKCIDDKPVRAHFLRENVDFIFLDSRMPKAGRKAVIDAAAEARGHPLVVLVGPADLKTREVLTDGLAFDSQLAKPIDLAEATRLIDLCCRARLPKRVMVVDDAGTVRSVIRKILQNSRFPLEVSDSGDGVGALERVQKEHFDLMFLDCNMPGLDGFLVCYQLRRDHPNVQVVMMTGSKDRSLEDRARATGAKDFLYKPFYARDIDAVLHRLFDLATPQRKAELSAR
ncbi:MAG: response regulator [Pseudomonadota bacterium]